MDHLIPHLKRRNISPRFEWHSGCLPLQVKARDFVTLCHAILSLCQTSYSFLALWFLSTRLHLISRWIIFLSEIKLSPIVCFYEILDKSKHWKKRKNDKKISWFCKVSSGRFRILTLLTDLGFWTLVAKFELRTQVACFRYGTLVADFGFWTLVTDLWLWPLMADFGFDASGRFCILAISDLFWIFDTGDRFWILDTSGRPWILDACGRFWILETSGRFGFWLLVAKFGFWPQVADSGFWTLVAVFGSWPPAADFGFLGFGHL